MRSSLGGLIGVSVPMQRLYRQVQQAASHPGPLLLTGEAGTGKELVARAIHAMSSRAGQPFVPVDCASLGPTLMESELLGYAKGTFIGASQPKQGLLVTAAEGTLFLSQIAELSLKLQAKFFHILQEREFSPVGSTQRMRLRARVIATTRQDLAPFVKAGLFREDLYFHLNATEIRLPPLRERKGDIPLLVEHFLRGAEESSGTLTISDAAMKHLLAYSWPGNIRELREVLRHMVARASDRVIDVHELPVQIQASGSQKPGRAGETAVGKSGDYRALLKALNEAGGDKAVAARNLGIGKSTLYRKLKQYGL